MWLVALLACAGPSDRELYLRAMGEAPEDAAATCAGIDAPQTRGTCGLHAAHAAARAGDEHLAFRLCDGIDGDTWREECHFLVADTVGLVGDDAVAACRRAGRFRSNCLGHAIGREVAKTEKQHDAVGREVALTDAIRGVVARYKPGAKPDQREATVRRIVAQILARRWEDGPFDVAACGDAPEDLCRLAYRMRLDGAPLEVDVEGVCAGELTLERVLAARAPGWVPASEAAAVATWRALCNDIAAGLVRRGADVGMGVPPRGPDGGVGVMPDDPPMPGDGPPGATGAPGW